MYQEKTTAKPIPEKTGMEPTSGFIDNQGRQLWGSEGFSREFSGIQRRAASQSPATSPWVQKRIIPILEKCAKSTQTVQRKPDFSVIQRAASIANVAANQVVNHRALVQHAVNVVEVNDVFLGHFFIDEMTVRGNPGFGRNVGHINGNGNNETRPSMPGGAHSEPILIGRTYGGAGNPNWPATNPLVDAANGAPAGRNNFVLFTERHPCGGCGPNLGNARYVGADQVNWAFPMATGTRDVSHSHIPRANANWPGFHFGVAVNPWHLFGVRIRPAPQPKMPDKKDDSGPKKDHDQDKDHGSRKRKRTLFDYGVKDLGTNKGMRPGDSAKNPIVVEDIANPGVLVDE